MGAGAHVGPRCTLEPGAYIGPNVHVGSGTRVGPNASLEHCRVGAHGVLHAGVRIGADGFGFFVDVDDIMRKKPQLLAVLLGDHVELGAGSCVDRGSWRDTVIGDHTKLDNLVQVGHNVVIGRNCLLCGQVGIAGSTVLGDNVVLGGQTGVVDNIRVGDRVITGAGTMLMANVPAGRAMLGYPATKMDAHVESYKAIRRLPRLFREVAALKKAVSKPGGDG